MQEILHAFGIDGRLIIIQIVNFSILMGLLWYFLYTPVLKMLADREAKIKKGVEDAEKAGEALAHAGVERTAIIKGAHSEAGQIVTRATQHGEEKGKMLISEAQAKIEREIESAKKLGEEIKAQALKESEAEIAKLSMLATEKVLNAQLSK